MVIDDDAREDSYGCRECRVPGMVPGSNLSVKFQVNRAGQKRLLLTYKTKCGCNGPLESHYDNETFSVAPHLDGQEVYGE